MNEMLDKLRFYQKAKEAKGWYERSAFLLSEEVINERVKTLEDIIGPLSKSIQTLENKKRK